MATVMNYLEFKRQLMVDPYERSEAFIAARRDNPDCTSAALESDRFEAQLRQAIETEVPADLLDSIQQTIAAEENPFHNTESADPLDNESTGGGKYTGWVPALAAGVAMGVGLTVTLFFINNQEPTLQEFVAQHWEYDGEATELMASHSPMDEFGNQQILATLSLEADSDLMQKIAYARNCGTPTGNGVHMVVRSGDELITVMYIPDAQMPEGQVLTKAGDTNILLGNFDLGVMAFFDEDEQVLQTAMNQLRDELQENQRIEI